MGDFTPHWHTVVADSGKEYYYNSETEETVWKIPNGVNVPPPSDSEESGDESPWVVVETDDGREYYFNESTGETSWSVPPGFQDEDLGEEESAAAADAPAAATAETQSPAAATGTNKPPNPWVRHHTDAGKPYFFNEDTNVTQWNRPAEFYTDSEAEDGDDESDDAEEEEGVSTDQVAVEVADTEADAADEEENKSSGGGDGGNKWVKKFTESVGLEEGEEYYLNLTTGETEWERPDDYESEEEAFGGEEVAAIELDLEGGSVADNLARIGVLSAAASADVDAMAQADSQPEAAAAAAARCLSRLSAVLEVVHSCGSEVEWDEAVRADGLALPRAIFAHWSPACPSVAVRLLVARLILLFNELQSDVLRLALDPSQPWGSNSGLPAFLAACTTGLSDADAEGSSGGPAAAAERTQVWLLLLGQVFAQPQPSLKQVGEEHPLHALLLELFDIMVHSPEEVFLSAAQVLVAINQSVRIDKPPPKGEHEQDEAAAAAAAGAGAGAGAGAEEEEDDATERNPVLVLCAGHQGSSHLGEALLHLINSQSCPYNDGPLLTLCLQMVQDLFMGARTSSFFFTNDLKVLVDIVIREITDLGPQDQMRCAYISTLRTLLLRSPWATIGRYRRANICEALEALMDDGGRGGPVNAEALQMVDNLFLGCLSLLEE